MVTTSMVKDLRERTGAGIMDCKRALQDADGSLDKAADLLKQQGLAKAEKKAGRTASQGLVEVYVHAGGRIAAMVEINCETDFVARNDDFVAFARDIALHIAAANPLYVSEQDVPEDVREAELRIFVEQAQDKPENVRPKIAEGRMRKWLEEIVLLNQAHVNNEKHGGKTIEELRAETSARTGENVVIRRFERFGVGEE